MSNIILITYASQTGSTVGLAEAIGETLIGKGAQVEVRPMKDVKDVAQYRAVVAGSAIHMGKWLPEAIRFIKTHRQTLSQKPFASFLVCMTLTMSNTELHKAMSDALKPVREMVKPVSEGLFAGALDLSKQHLISGLVLRAFVASGTWEEGDHRDWDAIRAWVESIHPLLLQ